MAEIAAQPTLARPKSLPWLQPAVFAGALTPLAVMIVRCRRQELTDPIAQLLNQAGLLALILLIATLACTPLKLITGWTWPLRLRRMLGLLSFFYALFHVQLYLGLDQGLLLGTPLKTVWKAVVADVTERNFILAGFAAFVVLIPLASTSTAGMVRLLGARRWQALHKLVYLAATLAVVHFVLRVKADMREPLIYAGILIGLLLIRSIYARIEKRRST
jgi:sulfoxide reductase heme-binding subunit YedZ